MKKIMLVTGCLSLGGAERMVARLANELCNFDLEIIVVVLSNKISYQVDKRVKVFKLNGGNKVKKLIFLRKTIKKTKPDFIIPFLEHICMLTVISTLCTKYAKRVFTTVRNNLNYSRYPYIYNLFYFKLSNKCIFQNYGEATYFKTKSKYKIVVIPNFVDNHIFSYPKLDMGGGKVKIIAVGRLSAQKNFEFLINSMTLIRDFAILDIYGDGELKESLQRLISTLQLDDVVELKGWTNDIHLKMTEYDVFALSSKFEGMPNVLMEAMALGMLVISTNCNYGPNELIVNSDVGYLIDFNSEEFASIVKELYINRPIIKEKGDKAKQFIKENFSADRIVSLWLELFK